MTVSAIIPTFNRRNYIGRAIESVLAQTVPVEEIVIVDDGSTDGTAEALEAKYGPRLRVIRQSNTGVSGARRRGIQEARGEWIAFLDSDDEWTPDRNRELSAAAARLPSGVAWIFGDLRLVTDDGENATLFERFGLRLANSCEVFADPLSVQYPFQFGMLQGSMIQRRALVELDCFNAGLRSDDDLFTGFQIACHFQIAAIPSVVGKYYRTSDLALSSVVVNGNFGADYFRSRMLSFAEVIESGRRYPWNLLYAAHVRELCKVWAAQKRPIRRLAIQQFCYGGVTAKGIAFMCLSMLGERGIRLWKAVAGIRRVRFGSQRCAPSPSGDKRRGTGWAHYSAGNIQNGRGIE